MVLRRSYRLKELPDLSNATNIEKLNLSFCESLVEIPSSVSELQKLQTLNVYSCAKLEVVPTLINLASLEHVDMLGCSQLRSLPEISTHVSRIRIDDTLVEEVPASFMRCTRLQTLFIGGSGNFKTLTHLPECEILNLCFMGIEKIPDCIKDLHGLLYLYVGGCSKLKCLPQLPVSLRHLNACDCESLESVSCTSFDPSILDLNLNFINCLKLNQQTRGEIIQLTSGERILPGREVPAEFCHQATGHFLTIRRDGDNPFSESLRFKACIVISPRRSTEGTPIALSCTLIGKNGGFAKKNWKYLCLPDKSPGLQSEHLCLFYQERCIELSSEILFEFSCTPSEDYEIVKCGVGIDSDDIDESDEGKYIDEIVQCGDGIYTNEIEQVQNDSDYLSEEVNVEVNKHGGCWSWLCKIALTGSSCLF